MLKLSAKNFAGLGAPILALGMAVLALYNYRSWLEQRTGYNFSFLDNSLVLFGGLTLASLGAILVVIWIIALIVIDITYSNLKNNIK
jgi:hypothetical protein